MADEEEHWDSSEAPPVEKLLIDFIWLLSRPFAVVWGAFERWCEPPPKPMTGGQVLWELEKRLGWESISRHDEMLESGDMGAYSTTFLRSPTGKVEIDWHESSPDWNPCLDCGMVIIHFAGEALDFMPDKQWQYDVEAILEAAVAAERSIA